MDERKLFAFSNTTLWRRSAVVVFRVLTFYNERILWSFTFGIEENSRIALGLLLMMKPWIENEGMSAL